ncbi:MAG: hypothetical protein H0T62_07475 [Parachlamydiaceae bacterium]|nr:hypothetical protein [Parachlamydiaceae bacterium]
MNVLESKEKNVEGKIKDLEARIKSFHLINEEIEMSNSKTEGDFFATKVIEQTCDILRTTIEQLNI